MSLPAAPLVSVTRGPRGASPSEGAAHAHSPSLPGRRSPCDGPLGPLVTWGSEGVRRVEERWKADETGRFPCPLPGHEGRAFIDYAPQDPRDEPRLLCCRNRWRSLGEVRAAQGYGADALRTNIEVATWTRLLAWEAVCFEPAPVYVPELPGEAPAATRRVREAFALLLGLRWADYERRPVAYSIRFAAAWAGVSFRQAREGIAELLELGVIREAGRVGRVRLYLPGEEVPS